MAKHLHCQPNLALISVKGVIANTPHTSNGRPPSHIGNDMPDQWPQAIVTTPELAKFLRVSRRTISVYIATRRIPFMKIGGSVRFNVADVLAALGKYTVKEVTFKQ